MSILLQTRSWSVNPSLALSYIHLWTRFLYSILYLNSSASGRDTSEPEGTVHLFPTENRSLRLRGPDSRLSHFTLDWELPMYTLKVMAWRCQQNIICKGPRGSQTWHLSVHDCVLRRIKQDWRQKAYLAVSNPLGCRLSFCFSYSGTRKSLEVTPPHTPISSPLNTLRNSDLSSKSTKHMWIGESNFQITSLATLNTRSIVPQHEREPHFFLLDLRFDSH